MFDLFGRFRRREDIERRCADCGARTIYYRCDPCSRRAVDISAAEAESLADLPTLPLPAVQSPLAPSPLPTPAPKDAVSSARQSLTADQIAYLAALPDPEPCNLDEPFPGDEAPLSYPALPAPMVAPLGDEFAETVVWLKLARETIPPIREDWSGCCPWCAREMREASDDTYTHKPRQAVITTCARHHEGQLELSRWIRHADFGGEEWFE